MVGGIVIEVVTLPNKVYVNCRDTRNTDECAIYMERTSDSLQIEIGDRVWWQGRIAFWTSSVVRETGIGSGDVKIPRVGFSGVFHPMHGKTAVRQGGL